MPPNVTGPSGLAPNGGSAVKMNSPMKSSKGMKDGKSGRMRAPTKPLERGGPEKPLKRIIRKITGGKK